MNRADIRNYNSEQNRAHSSDDVLVRMLFAAVQAAGRFFSSSKVRLAAAAAAFIGFLIATVGFAAGVDNGSISFAYVIPFLAALIGLSGLLLVRDRDRADRED